LEPQTSHNLPENVDRALSDFVSASRSAFGDNLRAVVLYGSAAEGRLRASSDVNVLLVLSKFDLQNTDALREAMRVAQAAIRLKAMFLLESELAAAVEAFAVKFADIAHRHRVIFGTDPFAGLMPSRAAQINRLRQTLLNLILRLREAYITRGLREEQLAAVIADAAGPMRAGAAALLELEGSPASSPKEALERFATSISSPDKTGGLVNVLALVSQSREQGLLPAGVAAPTLLSLIDIAIAMRQRSEALS
jgi:predicted nucleotidyltransferase